MSAKTRSVRKAEEDKDMQPPMPEPGVAPEEEEPEGEEPEGEEEPESEAEKAEVALGDLRKSLEALDTATAAAATGGSRKSYLEARFKAGTLSKSEQSELGRIWAGTAEEQPEPSTDITKSIREDNAEAGDLVDISPLLNSLVKSVNGALSGVRSAVSEESKQTRGVILAQTDVVKAQAKATLVIGDMVKSLTGRLERVETAPAPRRAVSTPAGITKSRQPGRTATGSDPDTLNKAQIESGFDMLIKSADNRGDAQAIDALSMAVAKYEQGYGIDPNVEAAIRAAHSQRLN